MTSLSRCTLSIVVLVPLLACNGSNGDSPTTPTTTNTPAKCRTYATTRTNTITLDSPGFASTSTESESCQFDKASRVLRCAAVITGGGCTSATRTTTYPTDTDFVEEADAIGLSRYSSLETSLSGNCVGSTGRQVFTYAPDKRPLQLRVDNSAGNFVIDTTYTAWDALGRPTAQSSISTGPSTCTATAAISYDDAGRKINGRVDGCSPNPTIDVSSYDAAGNLVSYVSRNGGSTYSWTSVVTATAAVCIGG